MKKVIAACIDKIVDFDTQEEASTYLKSLRDSRKEFYLMNHEEVNGKYRLRIQEQYNKTPLIND